MATITYNDLNIAVMLIHLAKQRNAFNQEELAGVDQCLDNFRKFIEHLKTELNNQSYSEDTIEPND